MNIYILKMKLMLIYSVTCFLIGVYIMIDF